jgi:hypothetical protein
LILIFGVELPVPGKNLQEFSKAQISKVCLHPGDGLLLPYGSVDWLDFIRRTALKLDLPGGSLSTYMVFQKIMKLFI